ncbi:MAG: hypothetical protein ABIE70_00895 [bacterium]
MTPRYTLVLTMITAMLLAAGRSYAQEPGPPTPVDSVVILPAVGGADSAKVDSLPEVADGVTVDSLAGDSAVSLGDRYLQFKKRRRRPEPLSWFDSLATYFTSSRLDLLPQARRATYRDAGDYFRSASAFYVAAPQSTPMRKTVQPFGLKGDRLGVVLYGESFHPFQHHLEPDGLIDLNLVPTALDDLVIATEGPAGLLFGGRSAVATMISIPVQTDDNQSHTAIMGEKGGYSYSWVRGYYSRRFQNGKRINSSIGYREAEGSTNLRSDDAYHYTGDMFFPLGTDYGFEIKGNLFDRDGYLAVRPEAGGRTVARDGFGRTARIALVRQSSAQAKTSLGYFYERQGSRLNGAYFGRYDITGHGAFVNWTRVAGQTMIQTDLQGNYGEYSDGFKVRLRRFADASVRLARLNDGWRWAIGGGARYDRDYDLLGWGTILLHRESRRSLVNLSLGYFEREPSLHEGYLHPTTAALYSAVSGGYVNEGDSDLVAEKQLVAGLLYELGGRDNRLRLSVTGGRIQDGIDWFASDSTDTSGSALTVFRPANGDIQFATVSARLQLHGLRLFNLYFGGSYHYLDYELDQDPAYAPEYQVFGAAELHYDWTARLADLYLYGELVFTGPYHGYEEQDLGQEPIFNVVAALELKGFRFSLAWENFLNRAYRVREYNTLPGRFFSYGISWRFVD